ncbi:hypothetical protein G6F46_014678 [Rhizopus delemar]|nr:hypothetical protein G6F46_014678 [Rhizopus delemar]
MKPVVGKPEIQEVAGQRPARPNGFTPAVRPGGHGSPGSGRPCVPAHPHAARCRRSAARRPRSAGSAAASTSHGDHHRNSGYAGSAELMDRSTGHRAYRRRHC